MIQIDWAKAEAVFDRLVSDYNDKRYPYDTAKPPQIRENITPLIEEWGGIEHRRFLFVSCYFMRGGIESDTAFKNLSRLYEHDKTLFDPKYFVNGSCREADEIKELLRQFSLGYKAGEVGSHWIQNFRKLEEHWGGDPARLFAGVTTYDEACAVVRNTKKHLSQGFLGFQHKMVSMLIYFLLDAGVIDRFNFPVPVDFHVLRLLVANEILYDRSKGVGDDFFGEDLRSKAREVTMGYCVLKKVDPIVLCDALWLLSRTLCQLHPGNRTRTGKRNAGRKTIIAPIPVTWHGSQVSTYLNTCAKCSIENTCVYNVPSAYYYVRGQLVPKGLRSRPNFLPFF